jgi:hypothetical protein
MFKEVDKFLVPYCPEYRYNLFVSNAIRVMKLYLKASSHNILERKENKGMIFQVVLKARTVTVISICEAKTALNGKFAARPFCITTSDMIQSVLLITGSKQKIIVSLSAYTDFKRSHCAVRNPLADGWMDGWMRCPIYKYRTSGCLASGTSPAD